MPRFSRFSPSRRAGFSLVEVAIALVIFVIGAVALLRIFPGGLSIIEDSGNRRVGFKVAQDAVTRLAGGDSAPEGVYDNIPGTNEWDDVRGGVFANFKKQTDNPDSEGLPSMPRREEEFNNSMLDRAKFIHGERQTVDTVTNSVKLNYLPKRRVRVYREGIVQGLEFLNGELDFVNATYLASNTGTTGRFRQPIVQVEPASRELDGGQSLSVKLDAASMGAASLTYYIGDASGNPIVSSNYTNTATLATPATISPTTSPTTLLTINSNPPANNGVDRNAEIFYLFLSASNGCSRRYSKIPFKIKPFDSVTTPGVNPTPTDLTNPSLSDADKLAIRAPSEIRGANTTYYFSYRNGTLGGVFNQPTQFADDTTYSGLTPHGAATTALTNTTFRFRTFLTAVNSNNFPVVSLSFPLSPPPPTIPEVGGNLPLGALTRASLDYEVEDWRYLYEEAANLAAPYSGETAQFVAAGPSETNQETLLAEGFGLTGRPRGEMREFRTSISPLYGKVYRVQLNSAIVPNPLDARKITASDTSNTGNLRKAMGVAFREGRVLFPAAPTGEKSAVYYQTADQWAQQLVVTPRHYYPFQSTFSATAPWRERWREYALVGKTIYFHPLEAGKRVRVYYSPSDYEDIVIDDKLVDGSAAPNGFCLDANNRKVVRSTLKNATVYDVCSPDIGDVRTDPLARRNPLGLKSRVAWLFNGNYQNEVSE